MSLNDTYRLRECDAIDFGMVGSSDVSNAMLSKDQQRRSLEFALNEILNLAFYIAAITSVTNFVEKEGCDAISQEALIAHLPPEPRSTSLLAIQLINSQIPLTLLSDFEDFNARLGIARTMTQSFSRYPAELRFKGGVHIEVLSGAWRNLCECTLELFNAIRVELKADKASARFQRSSLATSLLMSCANGGAPCVMSDGSVEVPGLIERRHNDRWLVDWPAVIQLGAYEVDARVVNISLGGCGLRATVSLQVSERVCVTLDTGRDLWGQVRWSTGHAIGLKFAVPLDASDPIMIAAQAN